MITMTVISMVVFILVLSIALGLLMSYPKLCLWGRVMVLSILFAYAVWLYFIPSIFAGWPTNSEPPKGAIIISYVVNEPTSIILWTTHPPTSSTPAPLKFMIKENEESTTRTYWIPYSAEMHRQMTKIQQEKKIMVWMGEESRKIKGVHPRELMKEIK